MGVLVVKRVRSQVWWCLALAAAAAAEIWGEGVGEAGRWAYLDPGAGSFLVQALVATIAGVAVATRAYWTRIKAFFGRGSSGEGDAPVTPNTRGDDE